MKKQRGITLIALVITVIVMMVLVGVTVTVTLNGGLFNTANKAARETTMAQIKERAETIRYTILAQIRTGDNSGKGIIEVYKDRLEEEFGADNVVIIGNKIIIDGKYEINIKNTNLDIEVREYRKGLVVGITTTSENSDVDENGNIHAIMMKFNLSTNVPSEKYEDYKNNITIDDKRDIVLSEYFEWYAQEFETLYEVICYEFSVERMEDYIYENEGIENATLGQIYYYYINLNCEGEYTEEEFIDKLKSEGILNVDVDSYYNKKTKNLKAIMVANGKETVLGTNYSVDSKPVVEFLVYENGVYDLKIVDNYEEIVAYEKVIVNNIVGNELGYYVPVNGPWKTNKEGRIIGYTGTETEITIPTYVGTEKITSLGNYYINSGGTLVIKTLFGEVEGLEKVIIPKGVTNIGKGTFGGCTDLKEVVIPDSVTTIEYVSFRSCTSLPKINIPNSVRIIEHEAFENCTSLTEISIPNSLTEIDYAVFKGCTSLTKVNIPNSIVLCSSYAFKGCTSLKEIELPNSIKEIYLEAFADCINLEKVKLPNEITKLNSGIFLNCSSLKEIEIPDTVKIISETGNGTFQGCTSLTEIVLPKNLTTLGQNVFKGCTGLTEIIIPKSVTSIEDPIFTNCTNLTNIYVEEGSTLTIPTTAPWGATKATVTVKPVE